MVEIQVKEIEDTNMSKADLGNEFRNPILFADYSDPDVIRVGDTFYMIASSFNYTPGLPILISKDLVNWKLVNYAIDNIINEPNLNQLDIKEIKGNAKNKINFNDFYIKLDNEKK